MIRSLILVEERLISSRQYVNPSIFNSVPQTLQHYSIITYLLIPPQRDPQFILANYPEAVGKGPPEVLFCILL